MIKRLLDTLDRLENGIATAGLCLMLLLVSCEIVNRNVFNTSFQWVEEVARYLMIWSVYFAAANLVSTGGHLRVELLLDRAGPRMRRVLNGLAELWVAVFGIAITISGYQFVESSFIMGFTSADSDFPLKLAWVYLVIPLTFCLTALHAALRLARTFRQRRYS